MESDINGPDRRLALQRGIVIAKITRYVYPHDWPDALDPVVEYRPQLSHDRGNNLSPYMETMATDLDYYEHDDSL